MNKKSIFILSIVITAFLLATAGGIARVASAKSSAAQPASTEAQYTGVEVQQALDQQAVTYQQAIAQANQQLEQANREIQRLSEQLSSEITNTAVPIYSVTADQALQIAMTLTGNEISLLKNPELVNYNSRAAYEVSFDKGVVYVDAETGEVLFNSVLIPISEQKAIEIAMQYMMSNQVTAVKTAAFHGLQVFKISFSSNYVVYIDQLNGQIVAVEVPRVNPGTVSNQSTPADQSSASNQENPPPLGHSSDEHKDESDDD
jgi:uncharacterized membrane protein YkoI